MRANARGAAPPPPKKGGGPAPPPVAAAAPTGETPALSAHSHCTQAPHTTQHSTAQHSTAQHSTTQHNTTQYTHARTHTHTHKHTHAHTRARARTHTHAHLLVILVAWLLCTLFATRSCFCARLRSCSRLECVSVTQVRSSGEMTYLVHTLAPSCSKNDHPPTRARAHTHWRAARESALSMRWLANAHRW
jgi:hypothetical protein